MMDNHSRIVDRQIPKSDYESGRDTLDSRGGNVELREPVKTVKCGNMERLEAVEQAILRKREWTVNFMYLTSAHLILYKDEKSAEKYGNHYAAPLGVCDLKGANVSWITGDKKKRKVIQVLRFVDVIYDILDLLFHCTVINLI
uniref:Adenine glycosylase n=1 Tax=Heterorhabditis bacteriophora TaxID=37862 RepID=A0A1I7XLR0_HETBA